MTNPFDVFDRLWERLRARSPRLQAADAHVDQTHVHHALVTAVVGWLLGVALSRWTALDDVTAMRSGIMAMWVYYFVREWLTWRLAEIVRRMRGRHLVELRLWDGACDVVVPLWVTAPLVFGSYELLAAFSGVVVTLYFMLRPIEPTIAEALEDRRALALGGPLHGQELPGPLVLSGDTSGRYLYSAQKHAYTWWPNDLGGVQT